MVYVYVVRSPDQYFSLRFNSKLIVPKISIFFVSVLRAFCWPITSKFLFESKKDFFIVSGPPDGRNHEAEKLLVRWRRPRPEGHSRRLLVDAAKHVERPSELEENGLGTSVDGRHNGLGLLHQTRKVVHRTRRRFRNHSRRERSSPSNKVITFNNFLSLSHFQKNVLLEQVTPTYNNWAIWIVVQHKLL